MTEPTIDERIADLWGWMGLGVLERDTGIRVIVEDGNIATCDEEGAEVLTGKGVE